MQSPTYAPAPNPLSPPAERVPVIIDRCPARAALAGNPSDGFGGAVVSIPVTSLGAIVTLRPSDRFEIDHSPTPDDTFSRFGALRRHVERYGYTGSRELVLASLRRFAEHTGITPDPCAISLHTTIPRSVGLAGSSAIIIATLRALFAHTGSPPPLPDVLASLALSVEVDELGHAAGLQDRVVQSYGVPVHMRFGAADRRQVEGLDAGTYVTIDCDVPPLVVAYRDVDAEPSQRVHGDLRRRYEESDQRVTNAMAELAVVAASAADALQTGDVNRLGEAMDTSFDIRRSVMDLRPAHVEMIETARAAGASANFAGSGGAIVAMPSEPGLVATVERELRAIGCDTVAIV